MRVSVQRNVIRRTSQAGIAVAQDTQSFPAPPVHDITITDNSLENVLWPATNGTGAENSLAAIQIVSTNNQSFAFATASSNTNVSVLNNYIADSGRSGMWIGELNGGTLQNNLVIRWNQHPEFGVLGISPQFYDQVVQDFAIPVVMHYSSSVTETSETISATSSITAPVTMTPSSVTLSGAGGSGSLTVQTAVSGFAWKAVSDSSWLKVTSGTPGAGSGTVQYSASANTTAAPRVATVTVSGRVFTVSQGLKKARGQVTSN